MPRLAIGLTGGVASGKSLAGGAFEALAVPVCDADRLARDIVAPGQPALDAIRKRFGARVLQDDGGLDRRALRQIVFNDERALRDLESITHPHIRESLVTWRDSRDEDYVILMVPILVESGMDSLVDRVLLIDATPEAQLSRLMTRDDIDESLARNMMQAQMPQEERLQACDDIIFNDGSETELSAAVTQMHDFYRGLLAGSVDRAITYKISAKNGPATC